ncbi:AGC kinase [Babesia caballi]|uniref:AGC kinase n=1 Tax=Babesia caballi TaxID=5871 RepID=A0AAV4LPV5_BABCB|nr:AGC kinase [Babesia caballi]
MKAGFLFSSDPKVSKLSAKKIAVDDTLGKRKYRLDDFEFERNIGCGNFSQVWHVTLKARPDESYALKIFDVQKVKNKGFVKFVQQERKAMLQLNNPGHPHVIRMVDTFRDENNVYLLYEYADGGELWEEIKNVGVTDKFVARILVRQLLDGLEYIHDRGIIHRDLKSENIVIKDRILKIIDFGTSQFANAMACGDETDSCNTERKGTAAKNTGKADNATNTGSRLFCARSKTRCEFENHVGTPNFMSPEAISNVFAGYAGDLWSLGCTIYQLLLGINCFTGSSNYFIYKKVKSNQLEFPNKFDPDAKDLITQLLVLDPTKRLNLKGIREHKFLSEFNIMPEPSGTLERFVTLDGKVHQICCKAQEAIFDLTIKRENVTKADHQEIEDAIAWLEGRELAAIADALKFNYLRTKRQVAEEIDEANSYMQDEARKIDALDNCHT